MGILLNIIFSVVPLIVFFLIGQKNERKHFLYLKQQEKIYSCIVDCNVKTAPAGMEYEGLGMVQGQVVIASDYFKTFASSLRNLFGGEMKSLLTLMERARREARLRLLQEADELGADMILNIRFETSTIGRSKGKKGAAMAEVHAYATAIRIVNNEQTEQQRSQY